MSRRQLAIPAIFVLLIVFAVTYYLRNVSNTYYFKSYEPPIACGSNKTRSACFNGTINVETVTGDNFSFTYTTADPPKIINSTGSIASFKDGEKIHVETSGDNTGDSKVVRSIRAIN